MNLVSQQLRKSVSVYEHRSAIRWRGQAVTYKEFYEGVQQWAGRISPLLRNQAQLRIGFALCNSAEYLMAYYAAIELGHIPFLIDFNMGFYELNRIAENCSLDYLLIDKSRATEFPSPKFDPVSESPFAAIMKVNGLSEKPFALRNDTVTCRFTSGTAGIPKCLEFSDHAIFNAASTWAASTGIQEDDKALCMAAISNGLAFNTSILSMLIQGAEINFFNGLVTVNNILKYVNQNAITRLVSYPTFYRLMSQYTGSLSCSGLRVALSAGSKLWPDVKQAIRNKFNLEISDYYGIAETGPVTFGHHGDSLGFPLDGCSFKSNDVSGELMVKTQSMASCYLNHPGLLESRITEDGYYKTSDVGEIIDGALYLIGRQDNVMNIGGRKVEPDEILNVVLAIDGVGDATVFAQEDQQGENMIRLVVVLSGTTTLENIKDVVNSQLSSYKRPSKIDVIDNIPRNGIGKVLKEQVVAQILV